MHFKIAVVLLGCLCLAEAGKYWNKNAFRLLKKEFDRIDDDYLATFLSEEKRASGEAPEELEGRASGEAPEELERRASGEAPEELERRASGEAPEELEKRASGEAPEELERRASGEAQEERDVPSCCKTKSCGYQQRKKCPKPERTITQIPKCCKSDRPCPSSVQCPETVSQLERSEKRQLQKIFRQLETLLMNKRNR